LLTIISAELMVLFVAHGEPQTRVSWNTVYVSPHLICGTRWTTNTRIMEHCVCLAAPYVQRYVL